MRAKRQHTKAEDFHLEEVAATPCVVPGCGAPSVVHHPRFCAGAAMRAPHYLGIAVCPMHHGGIHSPESFYTRYKLHESDLLALTIEAIVKRRMLAGLKPCV